MVSKKLRGTPDPWCNLSLGLSIVESKQQRDGNDGLPESTIISWFSFHGHCKWYIIYCMYIVNIPCLCIRFYSRLIQNYANRIKTNQDITSLLGLGATEISQHTTGQVTFPVRCFRYTFGYGRHILIFSLI
jgi:hypothetical protein